jgi:CRISPR/Cas system CSM-associated protein Csm2 small subunit
MQEILEIVKKEEKCVSNDINIDKCFNCNNDNLKRVNDYKHEFNNNELHYTGLLCEKCKTFYYLDNNRITYVFDYKYSIFDKEDIRD